MAKYKLLNGIHSEQGKSYSPGDIIETESDLCRLGTDKFLALDDVPAPAVEKPKKEETEEEAEEATKEEVRPRPTRKGTLPPRK